MRLSKSLFVVLMATSMRFEQFWGEPEENFVVTLKQSNFDAFLKKHKYIFVKFYAPWCHHCKQMASDYSKVAKIMRHYMTPVPLAEVEATIETELAEKYQVDSFPALKLFIDEVPVDYIGHRSANSMNKWLLKQVNSFIVEVKTLEQALDLAENKIGIFLILSTDVDEKALDTYRTVSKLYDEVIFYYTKNEATRAHYRLTAPVTLRSFRDYKNGRQQVSSHSSFSEDDIKNFVNANRISLVSKFDEEVASVVFNSRQNGVFLFSEKNDISDQFFRSFEQLAMKYVGEFVFSVVDHKNEVGQRLMRFFEVPPLFKNVVRVVKHEGKSIKKLKLEDPTPESLPIFIENIKYGRNQPSFKSEPIPQDNRYDTVKIIVGSTFEDKVFNNDKNIFLYGYAHWSFESMEMDEEIESLSEQLMEAEDIVFVKMNVEANEHPRLIFENLPLLRLYKSGQKDSPVDLTGDRTIEGILKFLQKELGREIINNGDGSGSNFKHPEDELDLINDEL
jgi:protein disulfide-isomerase A1